MAPKHPASDTESEDANSPKRVRTTQASTSQDASQSNGRDDADVEMDATGQAGEQSEEEEEPEDEQEGEEEQRRTEARLKAMQRKKKGVSAQEDPALNVLDLTLYTALPRVLRLSVWQVSSNKSIWKTSWHVRAARATRSNERALTMLCWEPESQIVHGQVRPPNQLHCRQQRIRKVGHSHRNYSGSRWHCQIDGQ